MKPTLITRGTQQIAVFNSWNKQDRLNYEQKKSKEDKELDKEASKELPSESKSLNSDEEIEDDDLSTLYFFNITDQKLESAFVGGVAFISDE